MNPLPPSIYLLLTFFFSSMACGAEYQPLMKKLGPTEKVLVISLEQDKANGGDDFFTEANDVVAAAITLQGLINRNSTTKVYLKDVPTRFHWEMDRDSFKGIGPGEGDLDEMFFAEGLIPYERENPAFDTNKKYPALLWLVEHALAQDVVKGKVLVPPLDKDVYGGNRPAKPDYESARAAGLTACGFEDGVMLTNNVDSYLKKEGFDLDAIADVREMKSKEAGEWAAERYLNHPDLNRTSIGFESICPAMFDYWVATKTFVMFYNPEMFPEDRTYLEETLDKLPHPPTAVFIGDAEGPKALHSIHKRGFMCMCGSAPNCSVTSSIPTDTSTFTPANPGVAHDIDPQGIYLSWHAGDGDAVDFVYPGWKGMMEDPARGDVPIGIVFQPAFVDLFPTWFKWWTDLNEQNVDLVARMAYGPGLTAPAKRAWADRHWHYLGNRESSPMLVMSEIHSGVKAPFMQQQLGDLLEYIITGYHTGSYFENPRRWNAPKFEVIDDLVFSNLLGVNVPEYNGKETSEAIRYTLEHFAKDDAPVFIQFRTGEERGYDAFSRVKETIEYLKKDPQMKHTERKLYFLRPLDLAATYRAWTKQQ